MVCPGCRAEMRLGRREARMTGRDIEMTTPPEHGEDPDRTCMTCAHCIEECCDMGQCELRLDGREPKDFKDWCAALDFMDRCRVDMQADTCDRWEEWR